MGIFKIKSMPGSAWPKVPFPHTGLVWSCYNELNHSQWLSPEKIEKLQIIQLNELLKHCYENVPYYRTLLSALGLFDSPISSLEEFRQIPILTRQSYQNNFSNIVATQLPDGMTLVNKDIYTSGTNGIPVQVYNTNRDNLWWICHAMRDWEWNQMYPTKKIAAIRLIGMNKEMEEKAMKGIVSPFWLPMDIVESEMSYGLDIRQSPEFQIEWLKEIQPSYLISLPSNLEVLASILEERGEKIPNLELIQTIGEPLSKETRTKLETVFGVRVTNLYSANEFGYIASQCPEGQGMHVHAENVLTEVLNDQNQPCKPGETGKLVATSLTNFITPFIRYDILDRVTLAKEPCSCGRGLPFWDNVDGRTHPMLYLANGSRKVSTGLFLGLRQIGGVHQFQVIQKEVEHFVVNVVPNKTWTQEHEERIVKYIQDEVMSPVRVDVIKHQYLDRTSFKFKIIEVEVK